MAAATSSSRTSSRAPRDPADATSLVIAAAMGDEPADTILENCSIYSVYTGELLHDMQVSIYGDRISYVGRDASHTRGSRTATVDLEGRRVAPGYADPHTHIDQFVMPSEFAKEALLCGVTSLFSDPIDVVSVAGYRGFEEFLRAGRGLPIRIFQTVPGGLPVDPRFSRRGSGATLAEQRAAVRRNPDVLGMGEVFSWTKVTERDPKTMRAISDMTRQHCIINGHTAGASGRKLAAYVASGIISCHEPINFEQAIERLRLGMWVMIREGSIRRDLEGIIREVISHGPYLERLMFCSDGLDPAAIREFGHIDHCVREAVRLGIHPVDAITMATRNVFDYYMMGRDLGGIAPGRLADILVMRKGDDSSFRPETVMVGGRTVVSKGRLAVDVPAKRTPAWIRRTVRTPRLSASDFEVRARGRVASANTIVLKTEIITGLGTARVTSDSDGRVAPHPDEADVWKVAAFDRVRSGNGGGSVRNRRSVGFLEGLGGDVGAFASTWSFHENDMIVIGSNDAEMAAVANHLTRSNGGVAVSRHGRIVASMPLQFAGIVSTAPFETVLEQFEQVNGAMSDAGCRFERPVLVPLFLPFLALPLVRMTAGGMVHVTEGRRVDPLRYGDA